MRDNLLAHSFRLVYILKVPDKTLDINKKTQQKIRDKLFQTNAYFFYLSENLIRQRDSSTRVFRSEIAADTRLY